MSFFFHRESSAKLPPQRRKKLPYRGPRAKRLECLRQFEVGRLYTFDLPDDVPYDLLLMENSHANRKQS